jgi:uncharacterized membrane protein
MIAETPKGVSPVIKLFKLRSRQSRWQPPRAERREGYGGRNSMSRYIGVIFADEAKADEGSRVLKDLHVEGNIALSGMAVVVKNATGALLAKKPVDEGPLGLAAGALIGGLAGLPGGPVGVVIGATGGALFGRAADLLNLGDLTNFFDKVSRELPPGNTAVVAEVTEHSGTSLCDTRMRAIGGTIVRE